MHKHSWEQTQRETGDQGENSAEINVECLRLEMEAMKGNEFDRRRNAARQLRVGEMEQGKC